MKKSLTVIIISIVFALAAGGAFAFVLYKTYAYASDVANLKAEVGNSSQTIANIAALNREIITTKKQRTELENIFLARENVSQMLKEIENIAQKSGVVLDIKTLTEADYVSEKSTKKSRRKKKKKKEIIGQITIFVEVKENTLPHILEFVYAIEHMHKAVKIERLHIVRSKEGSALWSGEMGIVFLSLDK